MLKAVPMALSLMFLLGALQGCANAAPDKPVPVMPLGQQSFQAYRADMIRWLQQRRNIQSADRQQEILWNAPAEWRPQQGNGKGILLVHGLGDSPWSYHDIGASLAQQGFLVRSVLLPGHGTRPQDMLTTRLAEWQQVVREQAGILAAETEQLYLGGFSTGANLVLSYAMQHDSVSGLLLFSPAFESDSGFDWLTPYLSKIRPWLLPNDGSRPLQNAVRYLTVPTNGFGQFYLSSADARDYLADQIFSRPVLMVVSEHDSVLDTGYLRDTFSTRFTHPHSRLIWYGDTSWPVSDARILQRSDYLPEYRISQFSHMGILFRPDNPLYGTDGSLRICWNGQSEARTQACQQGAEVWYSAWGLQDDEHIHARLTFNPYYDWQMRVTAEVLSTAVPGVQ